MSGVRLCSWRGQGSIVGDWVKHLERIYTVIWKTANILATLTANHLHLKNKLFRYRRSQQTYRGFLSTLRWAQCSGPGYFRKILDLCDKSGQLSKSLGGAERINLVRVDLGPCRPCLTSDYLWLKTTVTIKTKQQGEMYSKAMKMMFSCKRPLQEDTEAEEFKENIQEICSVGTKSVCFIFQFSGKKQLSQFWFHSPAAL